MSYDSLSTEAAAVLRFLGVVPMPPSLPFLDQLLSAYVRRVPWESAFRIAKRAYTPATQECPRWPHEFWHNAMTQGGGGTCFESNYAFFALLTGLGFTGYLTINNMHNTIGCHSAIIIQLDSDLWLVDVGMPLYAPIRLSPTTSSTCETTYFTYTATPADPQHYEIERFPHPTPYCFTLIDVAIDDQSYRQRTIEDYGDKGLFLDKVVISKLLNEQIWRFNSAESPLVLQHLSQGKRNDTHIEGNTAHVLAAFFGMDVAVLRQALAVFGL